MKITFLVPPSLGKRSPDLSFGCNLQVTGFEPLSILYPAAMLERDGHIVKFEDFSVTKRKWKQFDKWLASDTSEAYCIFTVFLSERRDKYAVKKIRNIRGQVPIIFSGPECSGFPDRFIADSNIFVIRGEPEYIMSNLFKGKELDKIKGLSWFNRKENKIIHNPYAGIIENLDELPFPARHLIKNKKLYFSSKVRGRPMASMLTGRRCFGVCRYCIPCSTSFESEIALKQSTGKFTKPPMCQRSPENVYHEFAYLKKMGYKSIVIMDDEMIGGRTHEKFQRVIDICDFIAPLKMKWSFLARADTILNEEMMRAMKRAGAVSCDIGVESFEQSVLNDVKKGIKVGDIYEAIFLLHKVGITPKINILLGASKYQTEESIKWTVKVLKYLPVEIVSFAVVIPHPWTEFGRMVEQTGQISTKTGKFRPDDPYTSSQVDFPNLSHDQLQKLVRWCYRSYYIRPSFIWRRIKRIRSPSDLIENITAFRNLFNFNIGSLIKRKR